MGYEKKHIALAALIGIIVGLIIFFVIYATGYRHFEISTPIGNLEQGKVYEVRSFIRDGQDYFLFLKTEDGVIKYYKLSASETPEGLEPGDGLVRLSDGIRRLPHEFSQP